MNNATSYSNINTYQRCPKKGYYRSVLGIQRKLRSSNLWRGILMHDVLKTFFLALQAGRTVDEAWDDVIEFVSAERAKAREQLFEDELFNVEQEIDKILYVADRYVERYVNDWTILHVEEEFYVTLDNGEVISFTPDLVIEDRNGFIWVVDHKTTSAVPTTGLPFGDTQALLYLTGVRALYGDLVKGFIFSRMRKKIPTQPRLTKTGKTRVADLARIDTTYEILRDFLQEKAPGLLNDGAHKRRLAELRDGGDKFFWNEVVYANSIMESQIIEDVAAVVDHIRLSQTTGKWPRSLREDRSYMSCSSCPYESLCHAELVGWDTAFILEDEYEPADPKNPYEGEVDHGED